MDYRHQGLKTVAASKKMLAMLFIGFCLPVFAQAAWLTMAGHPGDASKDLLEVEPQSRTTTPGGPTLNIRVSRSALLSSTEGIPFRSYTATILVDCSAKKARFVTSSFYMMPLWEGKPHTTLVYSISEIRPVLFRFFEPNPLAKIVRATCPAGMY